MTDHGRPDPDALLARIRQDEARGRRGRLRIYFGSSAGVGKTWAMLQAAHAAKAQGRDVLAGVVETHGRIETASLLEGLPLLPAARIEYRGRPLQEFDLDGALELVARLDFLLGGAGDGLDVLHLVLVDQDLLDAVQEAVERPTVVVSINVQG